MKSAARQIAETFKEQKQERDILETYIDPWTKIEQPNSVMVSVKLLNQLVKEYIGPSDLKPCPFCCKQPSKEVIGFSRTQEILKVSCVKCGISMEGIWSTVKRQWNRRG